MDPIILPCITNYESSDIPDNPSPSMNDASTSDDRCERPFMEGKSFGKPRWYASTLDGMNIQQVRVVQKVPEQFQAGEVYVLVTNIDGPLQEAYMAHELDGELNDGHEWSMLHGRNNNAGLQVVYLKENNGSFLKRLYKRGQGDNHNVLLVHYGSSKGKRNGTQESERESLTDMFEELRSTLIKRMSDMESKLLTAMKQSKSLKGSNHLSEESLRRLKGFHPKVIELIDELVDVKGDGHCGFHALAAALGKDKDTGWSEVRYGMMKELENHSEVYQRLMTWKFYRLRLHQLNCFESTAGSEFQFTLPDMGNIFASCYQCVLVVLAASGSKTYLPVRGSAAAQSNIKVIGIAFFRNHFMYVKLKSGLPIPPNGGYRIAEGWESINLPRLLPKDCNLDGGQSRGDRIDVDE